MCLDAAVQHPKPEDYPRQASILQDRRLAQIAGGVSRCGVPIHAPTPKKESGYHRQGTVENAFFRYQSILGDRLRARHPKAQEAETLIACNILNGMKALGRAASYAIGA